jgi:hypothetical protein
MWILSNWRLVLSGLFIAAFIGLAWVNNERGHAIDSMKLTIGQLSADKEQCAKDKKLTEDTSHAYQNDLSSLSDKLAAIKLRQPTHCIMPVTSEAAGRIPAARGAKPIGKNGITTGSLYDIAGQGEKYRLQLKACQQFVDKVWESNK